MRTKTTLILCGIFFAIVQLAQPAHASFDSGFDGPGYVGYSVNLTADGHIKYSGSSESRFDVYVTEYPNNSDRFLHNQSYGYIDSVSRINVTFVDVEGDLPAGRYVVWVQSHDSGIVHWDGVIVTYPAKSFLIPLEMVLVIVLTAIVTALGTYIFVKRRIC